MLALDSLLEETLLVGGCSSVEGKCAEMKQSQWVYKEPWIS